mmetsp:Transcript_153628/g.271146  ORF Transcript_153628/g.271146 Transcript_153628/m.271146 type:complete len:191 (+) Transcript_153628:123-695(+)
MALRVVWPLVICSTAHLLEAAAHIDNCTPHDQDDAKLEEVTLLQTQAELQARVAEHIGVDSTSTDESRNVKASLLTRVIAAAHELASSKSSAVESSQSGKTLATSNSKMSVGEMLRQRARLRSGYSFGFLSFAFCLIFVGTIMLWNMANKWKFGYVADDWTTSAFCLMATGFLGFFIFTVGAVLMMKGSF